MDIPTYFLTQPVADWSEETFAEFEQLWATIRKQDANEPIEYTISAPKWQFLNWLCDSKQMILHGSGEVDIEEFEPRKANDVNNFGNRRAVYAASDGIWAMYFAIVNRNVVTSLLNGCFRFVQGDAKSEPYYFFSINADAAANTPWRQGTVYLLPGETFEMQPHIPYRGMEIETAQRASLVPVKPIARLAVSPDDFPFLAQMHLHDPAVIYERAASDPDGFPWID